VIVGFKILLLHSTRSASDKIYQLLAHGRWFSPGTPASSITKTGRHDIAEILLKVALNTKYQIKLLCKVYGTDYRFGTFLMRKVYL
jgi:hypothetical protein